MRITRVAILLAGLILQLPTRGVARAEVSHAQNTSSSASVLSTLDRVIRGIKKIENLTVTYHRMVDYTPIPSLVARWRRFRASQPNWRLSLSMGIQRFTCRFSFLHGRALYERRIVPGGAGLGLLLEEIHTYTPQRAESLIWDLHEPNRPLGEIFNSSPLPHSTIDVALGLRAWRASHWLTSADVMKMKISLGGADTLVVNCVSGLRTEWWTFRLTPMLELVSFRDSVTPGDGEHVVYCSDFRSVAGVELPGRIVARFLPYGLHGACIETVVLTGLHYKLGSKSNIPSSYLLIFPKGASVLDTRTNHSFIIESRPRKMSDSAIYLLLKQNDSSLIVKPPAPVGNGQEPRDGSTAQSTARTVLPKPPPLGATGLPARSRVSPWLWRTILVISLACFAFVVWLIGRRIWSWKR